MNSVNMQHPDISKYLKAIQIAQWESNFWIYTYMYTVKTMLKWAYSKHLQRWQSEQAMQKWQNMQISEMREIFMCITTKPLMYVLSTVPTDFKIKAMLFRYPWLFWKWKLWEKFLANFGNNHDRIFKQKQSSNWLC